MADSIKVRVGDVALAMGQPFGLGQSGHHGNHQRQGPQTVSEIFKATRISFRRMPPSIPAIRAARWSTCAAELIGINTAILTHGGGGNQGIGFAVPINMARDVMDQVIEHGKVTRGYMGVGPEDISPAMAKALHLTDMRGVLIANVEPGSPAAQAGVQRGDVVREINGERVEDSNQLRLRISATAPGTTVRLKVVHDGVERTVSVKLLKYPNEGAAAGFITTPPTTGAIAAGRRMRSTACRWTI